MIEGILPECYFTNNLRGLSVDMAVFRDLLKLRLPRLSRHLVSMLYNSFDQH
jgi:TBC1 domain family member 30